MLLKVRFGLQASNSGQSILAPPQGRFSPGFALDGYPAGFIRAAELRTRVKLCRLAYLPADALKHVIFKRKLFSGSLYGHGSFRLNMGCFRAIRRDVSDGGPARAVIGSDFRLGTQGKVAGPVPACPYLLWPAAPATGKRQPSRRAGAARPQTPAVVSLARDAGR